MAAAQLLDDVGEAVGAGDAERPEGERPAAQLADLGHRVAGPLDGGEDGLGPGPERLPGLGEDDPAPGPHEQGDAELRLEGPDLLGERGLGQVERAGGRRERAVAGRGEEIPELLQIHRRYLDFVQSSQAYSFRYPAPSLKDMISILILIAFTVVLSPFGTDSRRGWAHIS